MNSIKPSIYDYTKKELEEYSAEIEARGIARDKEKGIEPEAVAGFSLGEFPALYDSGVLSFEDTIKLVTERGKIMFRMEIALRWRGRWTAGWMRL